MIPSQFNSSLDVRKVGACDWLLLTDLVYVSELLKGIYVVKAGVITDFASIPSIAQILFPKSDLYDPAAVVHDDLYTNQIHSREVADAVFREACIACGVNKIRADIMYHQLRIWGWIAWNKHTEERIKLKKRALDEASFPTLQS